MIKVFSSGIRRISSLPQFLEPERNLYGALEGFERSTGPESVPQAVVGWGHKPTAEKARAYARENNLPYIALEDGFYRSLKLGADGAPPLSITVDPIGVYYDAGAPSEIERLLNDWQSWFSPDIQKAAQDALTLIRSSDLSKYNSSQSFTEKAAADFRVRYSVPELSRMILVVDQTASDASVRLGGADESSFQRMLNTALLEENAVVFVKTHPDVIAGKKKGYFSEVPGNVRLVSENWAPLSFMQAFDAVYVVTSQMGFEALLINKPVHVFGVPFYAGWGLTVDHSERGDRTVSDAFSRRWAKPTVEGLFAAAVLKLSRYVNPFSGERCSAQEVLEILATQRAANERNRGRHVCIGFRRWKQPHAKAFLSGTASTIEFVWNVEKGLERAKETGAEAVMWAGWAGSCTDAVASKAKREGIRLSRMEDGFLRSVGLGSDYNYPYSLILDPDGIYYDPAQPSQLENILKNIRCRSDHDLLIERARSLRTFIVQNHLSKYNVGSLNTFEPDWVKEAGNKCVILVPGQVDGDASVRRGGGTIQSNLQLLASVRQDNPEAFIVYKPHPDVESGNRIGNISQKLLAEYVDCIAEKTSLESLWPYINEIHTLTSLTGFEGLCRNKKVTTYGSPFYSGWGLTTDKWAKLKSLESLTIDDLIAGVLILYPYYWDWKTRQFGRPEDICRRLLEGIQPKVNLWCRCCRVYQKFSNRIREQFK